MIETEDSFIFENRIDIIYEFLELIKFAYHCSGIKWRMQSQEYVEEEEWDELEPLRTPDGYVLTHKQIRFLLKIIDNLVANGTMNRGKKIYTFADEFEKRKIPIAIYRCFLFCMLP